MIEVFSYNPFSEKLSTKLYEVKSESTDVYIFYPDKLRNLTDTSTIYLV